MVPKIPEAWGTPFMAQVTLPLLEPLVLEENWIELPSGTFGFRGLTVTPTPVTPVPGSAKSRALHSRPTASPRLGGPGWIPNDSKLRPVVKIEFCVYWLGIIGMRYAAQPGAVSSRPPPHTSAPTPVKHVAIDATVPAQASAPEIASAAVQAAFATFGSVIVMPCRA